ncbi:MAG: polysaccharide deacetylase family protein [Bacteroidales bacterium]|nr:polysaccharide deacetylase family protein [Bacteroidales bacterium]
MRLVLLSFIISISGILFSCQNKSLNTCYWGAIIRGDTTRQQIALVFTGDEYADGGYHIYQVLNANNVEASFFFTGNFYRNPENVELIKKLISDGHYLGAHSDRHLLYCDWENRDSLLVDFKEFSLDLENNYLVMEEYGINKNDAKYFLPPYEWYNDTISRWCNINEVQLVNYTPGTLSHADYTSPEMPNYRSSSEIYMSITEYESESESGLNGFILLLHIGTTPERTDKFYSLLPELISELEDKGYSFRRIDELL